MTHSDDDGLVLPPRIAPKQIVILPIYKSDKEREEVLAYCRDLQKRLMTQRFRDLALRVAIDDRDLRGGEKAWQHIKKGVPLRIEVGPRDLANNSVFMGRRDLTPKDKRSLSSDEFVAQAVTFLEEIQEGLLERAQAFRDGNTRKIDSQEDFVAFFAEGQGDLQGGFALCHWHDDASDHELLKKYKVTPRCIPMLKEGVFAEQETGRCLFTGKESKRRIILAKSY